MIDCFPCSMTNACMWVGEGINYTTKANTSYHAGVVMVEHVQVIVINYPSFIIPY
jgi:hypothetical protein